MPGARVVYWNSQPSPYVVERFNAVVATGQVQLEAWFDKERDSDRSWDVDPDRWGFPAHYLPTARIGNLVVPFPGPELRGHRPDVLVTPMDRMAGMVAAVVGQSISRRVAARTLPVFETWVPRTARSEAVNHFLYRSIDGAKVSGAEASAMARRYGLPLERTWKVTQSIDLDLYSRAREFLTSSGKRGGAPSVWKVASSSTSAGSISPRASSTSSGDFGFSRKRGATPRS